MKRKLLKELAEYERAIAVGSTTTKYSKCIIYNKSGWCSPGIEIKPELLPHYFWWKKWKTPISELKNIKNICGRPNCYNTSHWESGIVDKFEDFISGSPEFEHTTEVDNDGLLLGVYFIWRLRDYHFDLKYHLTWTSKRFAEIHELVLFNREVRLFSMTFTSIPPRSDIVAFENYASDKFSEFIRKCLKVALPPNARTFAENIKSQVDFEEHTAIDVWRNRNNKNKNKRRRIQERGRKWYKRQR